MQSIIGAIIAVIFLYIVSGRGKARKVEKENIQLKREVAEERIRAKEEEIVEDSKKLTVDMLHHRKEYKTNPIEPESEQKEIPVVMFRQQDSNELPDNIRELAARQARRHSK